MLSVAPPAASLVTIEPGQLAKYDDGDETVITSRPVAGADADVSLPIAGKIDPTSGDNYSLRPNWPDPILNWPNWPAGGEYYGRPMPDDDIEPAPAESPGESPLSGMIDIGEPKQTHIVPFVAPESLGNNKEARDVLEMLSTLRYVPANHSTDDSHQPVLAPSLGANGSASTIPDAHLRAPTGDKAEGGMSRLVRKPIVEESASDQAISAAAIDALLEIPTKVDGVQGRFQAFEISVNGETPLPVSSSPLSGSRLDWPLRSSQETTPALIGPAESAVLNATDVNPMVTEAPTDEAASGDDVSAESIDAALASGPTLDLATATILAALIGRALWPLRASAAQTQGKDADQTARPRATGTRFLRLLARWDGPCE